MLDSDIKMYTLDPSKQQSDDMLTKKHHQFTSTVHTSVEDCPKCQQYQNMPKMDVQFLKSVTILDSDGKSAHFKTCQPPPKRLIH